MSTKTELATKADSKTDDRPQISWPAYDLAVENCSASAAALIALRSFANGLPAHEEQLARTIRGNLDRIADVVLQGLAISPDARAG